MRLRKTKKTEGPRWKLLLWTVVASLIFGLIGAGELPEDMLRAARNQLHAHPASGDIVLVTVDDHSLQEVGRWPWPRRRHAEIIDALREAGAKRMFLDIILDGSSDPVDDAKMIEAVKKAGNVTLAVSTQSAITGGGEPSLLLPPQSFSENAELGLISVAYNYQNAVWRLHYARSVEGQTVQSFAALLANAGPEATGTFIPDYSIDPRTVPLVSARDVLNGRFDPRVFAGKDVVIGSTAEGIDQYFIPGWGKMGGAFVHIIGAETLKAGRPIYVGWLPALALAFLACWAAVGRNSKQSGLILGATAVVFLTVPIVLESRLIFVDITPGVFAILIVSTALGLRRWKQRGLVNTVSGLPNLSALRAHKGGRDRALIAARILNYSEIASALPADQERQLVDQIVSRLRVGAPDRTLYEGDAGIFAWFEDPELPFGNHVEALYSLFRNPARVGGQTIDLAISFGVEIGSGRSLTNRFASALLAADEAAHDGLKWKYYDPEALEDASWKLSILSQLDNAVDKGEVWVAYQPKFDLKKRRIIGAEALARWTHPEKGPIAASEFIAAAEQHDRIGKLTDYVLEQAIAGAVAINRRQQGFTVAVNLSARLLSDKGLILRLRAMLARHGLPATQLTLELTETAELANSGTALDMLAALRGLGVTIAIDDYGTGLSTLDYLKKIPAGEIKIDQSFVKTMLDNRSDLVMVQSTIALAHSLGRKVVAEGVESQSVLDALIDMGCDVAQGYVIGRPMSIESLAKRLSSERRSSVA